MIPKSDPLKHPTQPTNPELQTSEQSQTPSLSDRTITKGSDITPPLSAAKEEATANTKKDLPQELKSLESYTNNGGEVTIPQEIKASTLGKGASNQVYSFVEPTTSQTIVFKPNAKESADIAAFSGIDCENPKSFARNNLVHFVDREMGLNAALPVVSGKCTVPVKRKKKKTSPEDSKAPPVPSKEEVRTKEGFFMPKVEGTPASKMGDAITITPTLLKNLTGLHARSLIAGELDGHKGDTYINGDGQIQTIDADVSFPPKIAIDETGDSPCLTLDTEGMEGRMQEMALKGFNNAYRGFSRTFPKVLDFEHYSKIMSMSPDGLREQCIQAGLTNKEADGAKTRLESLQKHLKSGKCKVIHTEKEWMQPETINLLKDDVNKYLGTKIE